jgi:undecaprenyl phosphate-alpha-L-ara4FN deformylase
VSVGLRIDVDTFRGTRDGVPQLLESLRARSIHATWFVTLGPDNMGRHLWRMLRPAFAMKMLRSNAASLYGWDILLRGTLFPGPVIGDRLAQTLRSIADHGHEVGVHAWDHHRWQMGVESMTDAEMEEELARASAAFVRVFGRAPECAAAPGWRCTERVLALASSQRLAYRSDCRGVAAPFLPLVKGSPLDQPQVPVDLPTFDEGWDRSTGDASWNESLLECLADGAPHVLTIHAESEGGAKRALFEQFLDRAMADGHRFTTLRDWLREHQPQGARSLAKGRVAGREGWVCTIGESR